MKINLNKTENIEMTDAISDYLSKKINMLDKFVDPNDESAMCDVELGKWTQHHNTGEDLYYCDLTVHVAGGYLTVKEEEGNLYAAIDRAKDEMAERLRSKKEKRETLVRRGGAKFKEMLRSLKW